MLNMANEGFGSGRTIGYTLSWIDAVVWAVGRIGWLNGQRVEQPMKGVYIKNGKKVIL